MLQKYNNTFSPSYTTKVLTPCVSLSDNKYLDSLWAAVRPYGVEVECLNLYQSLAELKAVHRYKLGNVIHLHWTLFFCAFSDNKKDSWRIALRSLIKLSFLKAKGYQIVWTVHNSLAHDCSSPRIEKSFRWILTRLCNDIIVMSEYSRQEFARSYRRTKRIHLIPHGNYVNDYLNQINRLDARQKLGILPHQKVLLNFGRVMRYKGISNLLAAFSQLQDRDVVLLVAGVCKEPDLLFEIQQAARADPRIILRLEYIPDEDIQVYMNACNWVVLPYQKILNSGSALLALSFKRPVIVPQRGALTELIKDGEHGFCYQSDRELTPTLNRALASSFQQWQQMCDRAFALAQKYDWSKIGAQLYQVYQQGI